MPAALNTIIIIIIIIIIIPFITLAEFSLREVSIYVILPDITSKSRTVTMFITITCKQYFIYNL
jgi:hypothetical protein